MTNHNTCGYDHPLFFTSLAFDGMHFYVEIHIFIPDNSNPASNPEVKKEKRTSWALYMIVQFIHATLQKIPDLNG